VTKDQLRAELKQKRKAFVRNHKSPFPFAPKLLDHAPSGSCVAIYAAMRWEADIALWNAPLLQSGRTLALPYLAGRDALMEFRSWDGASPLEKAVFDFQQPAGTSAPVWPDTVLIPLIGFDRGGGRLGQGAGHYDRYLAKYPYVLKLGIAWSCQEVGRVPIDPWDIPLDAVITEGEWINCSAERAES
jgi:5-formyltetrahydrofolate cyclo-ligase